MDGVEFERPDHEGLMFDSFLNIANGFGLIERPAQDMSESEGDDELIEDNVDEEMKRQHKRAHTQTSAHQRAENSTSSDQTADQSSDMRKLLEDKPERDADYADASGKQETPRRAEDAAKGELREPESRQAKVTSDEAESVDSKEPTFVDSSQTAVLDAKQSDEAKQSSDSASDLETLTLRPDVAQKGKASSHASTANRHRSVI